MTTNRWARQARQRAARVATAVAYGLVDKPGLVATVLLTIRRRPRRR